MRGSSLLGVLVAVMLLGLSPAYAATGEVTLVAVGDLQLGRGVGRLIAERGADYPYQHVCRLLQPADLAIGNLECALSKGGRLLPKEFSFRADPTAAAGLAAAGFDILCLANNHSIDCGRAALAETTAALRRHGLQWAGARLDRPAGPLVVTRHGLRLAFLAYTMILPDGLVLREDAPGPAILDIDRAIAEVQAARRQADLVVVSLHWGVEYARHPQEEQRRLAHRLVDAGAALIIGHHPHTVQPLERYQGAVIAYSLGNFVFDSPHPRGQQGAILRCTLTRAGAGRVELLPVDVKAGQPIPSPPGRGDGPYTHRPSSGMAAAVTPSPAGRGCGVRGCG